MRNSWNAVLKDREKHNQARNSERSDRVGGIDETGTPRMTAHRLVKKLVSVLYPRLSDVQLYRPASVFEIAAIKIDMIKTNHSSTEIIIKMLLHLGYFFRTLYIPAACHYVVGMGGGNKFI